MLRGTLCVAVIFLSVVPVCGPGAVAEFNGHVVDQSAAVLASFQTQTRTGIKIAAGQAAL